MQTEYSSKSKSLLGVSELTVVAPIKRGLVPGLDARGYETRLRLVMRTLHGLRVSSQEADPTPALKDVVDRIRAIHSFRLAIVAGEPRPQLLLAVTFDGGWEAYLRRIWRDLGPLLDVLFCNCEGYLLSYGHDFADYAAWVRKSQPGTEFFYNASSLTVNDLHYLRESTRERIDDGPARAMPSTRSPFEQTLPALAALYRLSDMHPPKTEDGECLLRAAHRLLQDFDADLIHNHLPLPMPSTPVERAALGWYGQPEAVPAAQAAAPAAPEWNRAQVQGGIIVPYPHLTHGCMLLVGCRDAAAVLCLIGHLRRKIVSAEKQAKVEAELFFNLGFTLQGLQLAGVAAATLDALPQEFKEGMAARAGILGDLLHNHPTRWALPERHVPAGAAHLGERVELSSVHAVVQVFLCGTPSLAWEALATTPGNALSRAVDAFGALSKQGVEILSLQPLQRFAQNHKDMPKGHFGFVDGLSQPTLGAPASPAGGYGDNVAPGDLLLGYPNSLGDRAQRGKLWEDSSFLVIRKLRQDVAALNKALASSGLAPDVAKAALMGRGVDGKLADGSAGNNFNHDGDPDGARCPVQSHIRRANPRTERDDMRSVPRIVRRGMSYGPRMTADNESAERGLVFMAYNASIAEQFEVLQAWLAGGNSAGRLAYSALHDPLLGVAREGDPRSYRFTHFGAQRLDLGEHPFVTLEWGSYVFVPSLPALDELAAIADRAAKMDAATSAADAGWNDKMDERKVAAALLAQRGAGLIARLRQAEAALGFEGARTQWKIALEDLGARTSGIGQAIWGAVRDLHGGVLRTPYGVLVGGSDREKGDRVLEVLSNDRRYSATGYAERMKKSFGEIYLGMDAGPDYEALSGAANAAIGEITRKEAFDAAHRYAQATVHALVPAANEPVVDVKDIADGVLERLCVEWFGLPDGVHVAAGGWHWREDMPTCPGHFVAPSRCLFQPNPGTEVKEVGERHGQALQIAVRGFIDKMKAQPQGPKELLLRKFAQAIPDPAQLTRTLIGAMMGFLPTVDGNLRATLYEWTSDRSLWDHRRVYRAHPAKSEFERAQATLLDPLVRTMQLRPVPELVWRTSQERHDLGTVQVEAGERIVVGIVSAMQQRLADGDADHYAVFGGNRRASPHPTHACPGYEMAMGVLLGTIAGVLDAAQLRPTLSPLAWKMRRA